MEKKKVNIILACNNNYIPYLAVTISSIIYFASPAYVYEINVLYTNITDENVKEVSGMSTANVKINFINVSKNIADKVFYTKHHISEETYYRALIPELFPGINKVLYLDCDLVVNRDVAELYNININNYIIGAVKNFNNQRMNKYISEEIHIDPSEYFNAGVLLLNLKKFRSEKIASKFFDLAHGEKKYNLMDQDFLNILCNKKILYLDPRWNVSWQHVFSYDDETQKLLDSYRAEYDAITSDPYIIHYTTEKKAWDYKDAPLAEYFWKIAEKNNIFMNDYNKERILLVTHEMDYAGSEHSLKRVCMILMNAGYKVDVWSYQQGDFANEFKKIGVQIKFVNKNKLDRPEYTSLFKRYSLIIANTVATYNVVDATQDIVPTIWYIREAENIPQFYRTNSKLYKTLYKAYCIYTVSEYARDFIVKNYNPNVNVIHNCVDDEYGIYGNDCSKENKKVKFLTLGTIEERKGYDIYFRAYMSLPEEYRDKVELHFAGRVAKWAEKYAEEMFEEIKPYEGIVYHGEIQDRKKLLELVNDMNVVVVASRDESCSLVALEGAMMKKPLIVTKNVGAKYIVDESSGWIVNTGNIDDMRSAYMAAVDSLEKLYSMGENSRKNYLETSTFEMLKKNITHMAETYKFKSDSSFNQMKKNAAEKQYAVNMDNYPSSLITYDIFDTLLTRMTATPKGVFALVQYILTNNEKYKNKSQYIKQNFYDLRVNAEFCARNALITRQKDEITLDEIYSAINMTHEMSYASMKEIEDLERNIEYIVSVPIISMVKEASDKIKGKYPVSYASDMYLEKEFIRKLLHKADHQLSTRKIYVSSAYDKSKASGSLYNHIKNEEKIAFSDWVHIGDNERSDYEIPKKYGIRAKQYSGSKMLQWESDLIRDNEDNASMQLAVGAARNARINSNNNSMAFKAGVSVGAMSVYAYVRWIISKALNSGIDRLYFVARDGYVLKIIADTIIAKNGYNLKTKYIYGSRLTWRLPSLYIKPDTFETYFNESLPHFITKVSDFAEIFGMSTNEICEFIPNSYKCENISLDSDDVTIIKNILLKSKKFRDSVCKSQKDNFNRVCGYIKQELDFSDDKFAFVELNGSGFTQYCLSNIISSFYSGKVTTFFLKLNSVKKYESDTISLINYFPNNIKASHIVEALCRAPHGQTYAYELRDNKYYPLFEKSEGEALIKYGFKDYSEGVAAFAEYMADAERETGIVITSCVLTQNCLNYLSECPAKELIDYIGDIPFGPTGREKVKVTFAPVLTDEQIKDIYLYKKKLQSVYNGAALDISIKRCSSAQKTMIENFKNNSENKDTEKTSKTKVKRSRPNMNFIQNSKFSDCIINTDVSAEIIENMDYNNTFSINHSELFTVGNYISVYSKNKNPIVYSAQIDDIFGGKISYTGKTVSFKFGDTVYLNELLIGQEEKTVWQDWKAYSTEMLCKVVKTRTGLLLLHPGHDNLYIFRFGTVLKIPEKLRGKKVTLSLQCGRIIGRPQLNFTTKKHELSLSSAGMLDDCINIDSDGIVRITSYIPKEDNFMRIMIQIPSKNDSQILIQNIKLEEGSESTIVTADKNKYKYFFNFRNISDGIMNLRKKGIKYAVKRFKDIIIGNE